MAASSVHEARRLAAERFEGKAPNRGLTVHAVDQMLDWIFVSLF
jgi:hypothetical protein